MDSGKDQKNTPSGEKQFTTMPIKESIDPKFAAHQANPGPAMLPKEVNVPQEGTKEERRAKAAEWNK